jgi:hypothetical protein
MMIKTLVTAAVRAAGCRFGGMWATTHTYVTGRAARLFERERRHTYQTVPQTLPPGTRIYDRRSDGSVLEIHTPPDDGMNVTIDGNTVTQTPPSALPTQAQPAIVRHQQLSAAPSQNLEH